MPISSVFPPIRILFFAHLMQIPHGSWYDGGEGQASIRSKGLIMQSLCRVYAEFMALYAKFRQSLGRV